MNESEINFLKLYREWQQSTNPSKYYNNPEREKLKELLMEMIKSPFGQSTTEFHQNLEFKPWLSDNPDMKQYYELWYLFESYYLLRKKYVHLPVEQVQKNLNDQLLAISKRLEQFATNSSLISGKGILLIPTFLVKNAFLSEDPLIMDIFKRHLPLPREHVFKDCSLKPKFIEEQLQNKTLAIRNFLTSRNIPLMLIEKFIIQIQRKFRAKIRKREEIDRLVKYYKLDKKQALETLSAMNTPQKLTKCKPDLEMRILSCLSGMPAFPSIQHVTGLSYIHEALDTNLFGRRNLCTLYVSFEPAAFGSRDVPNGDANVICFGPNQISPECVKKTAVEISVDFNDVLSEKNPCAFFKCADLGYKVNRIRKITIGNEEVLFSHTVRPLYRDSDTYSLFEVYPKLNSGVEPEGKPSASAFVWTPNFWAISSNVNKMNQIRVLHFFRLMENLYDSNTQQPDPSYAQKIYAELEKLDDAELSKVLYELGQKINDTLEFNFYGAYRISMPSILSFTVLERKGWDEVEETFVNSRNYTLDMKTFIESLKLGDLKVLQEAKESIPNLFNSYRFVHYLLGFNLPEPIAKELLKSSDKFSFPLWMKEMHIDKDPKLLHEMSFLSMQSKGATPHALARPGAGPGPGPSPAKS